MKRRFLKYADTMPTDNKQPLKNDKCFDIVRHISPCFDNFLDIEYPLIQ